MEMGGYAKDILTVNLTTGEVKKEPIKTEFIKKFIGGNGGNCRLAYDLIKPGMDSFSEDSPIIIGAGPLVGIPAPAVSKSVVMYKHPAYGTIANGNAGGDFGTMLKWAGYGHLIITGKSDRPVYLKIHNDNVEICDGSQIWGKDLFEATDTLWDAHNGASVYCIGPAGEKLVKTSVGLIDKLSTWGKGGLPAIMGSKKLKAIVVSGTKGVSIADPERLKNIVIPMVERIRCSPKHKTNIELGTIDAWNAWFIVQGASYKNWRTIFPHDKAYQLYGVDIYLKNIKKDRIADVGCPVGCKDHVYIREGEFAGLDTHVSSFYGRLENFAARCNVGSFNRAVKAMDYCQRMGVCIHSITALIDWAVDLYKHGILTKEDTGGLELEWDFDTTMKLLEQVARNEGFGAVIGEGYLGAIEKIGRGCEKLAIHVKGMEPLYDARVNRVNTFDFFQVVSPRGAHPPQGCLASTYMSRDLPADAFQENAERLAIPKEAIRRIFTPPGRFNVARLTKWAEEQWVISNSLGIGCLRGRIDNFYDMQTYAEIYSAVTGSEITTDELHLVGERAYNLLKVLNLREGFTRKDDKWPDRWFEPLIGVNGEEVYLEDYFGKRLTREDCERMLDDYYDERGWDIKLGIPTKKKLTELGLGDIAKKLEESGYLKSG